jgi:hypothetical protein
VSDFIGVAFNETGSGFLDTAQVGVKSSATGTKAVPFHTADGYLIFTTKGGAKAYARFQQIRPGGEEGTFQFIEGA